MNARADKLVQSYDIFVFEGNILDGRQFIAPRILNEEQLSVIKGQILAVQNDLTKNSEPDLAEAQNALSELTNVCQNIEDDLGVTEDMESIADLKEIFESFESAIEEFENIVEGTQIMSKT